MSLYLDMNHHRPLHGIIQLLQPLIGPYMGLGARKPVFKGLRTTKAQTSLRIRAFVISFLESTIYILATGEISIF